VSPDGPQSYVLATPPHCSYSSCIIGSLQLGVTGRLVPSGRVLPNIGRLVWSELPTREWVWSTQPLPLSRPSFRLRSINGLNGGKCSINGEEWRRQAAGRPWAASEWTVSEWGSSASGRAACCQGCCWPAVSCVMSEKVRAGAALDLGETTRNRPRPPTAGRGPALCAQSAVLDCEPCAVCSRGTVHSVQCTHAEEGTLTVFFVGKF
jgi:hypothetical protein